MNIKICCKCKQEKEVSHFGKDKLRKDGLRPDCKECRAKETKEYRIKYKDRKSKQDKDYYIKNKDKISEYKKKHHKTYYDEDKRLRRKEIMKVVSKTESFRLNRRIDSHNRRIKTIYSKNIKSEIKLLVDTTSKCYWCGCELNGKYHIDHYIPISRGGSHTIENIVISCQKCNLVKSSKDPIKFANSLGRLL